MVDVNTVKKSICSEYSLEEIGIEEYLIHTGMYFDDGDELHIVLKCMPDSIILTDEGHTLMWLSYEEFNFTETRRKLLNGYIEQNNLALKEGQIQVLIDSANKVGPALSSLMQALLQIACLRNLSRNNVVNTFTEDVYASFRESRLSNRCEYRKKIATADGNCVEPDILITGNRPVLLFVAGSSERAKEVTINLLVAKELKDDYGTIVVIDGDSNISKKDQQRLVNYADRPIYGIDGALAIAESYIAD